MNLRDGRPWCGSHGQGSWALPILRSKALTCGYSRALGGTRTPDPLIRRLCHPVRYLPIPTADLPKCCSLVRSKWHR